MTTGTRLGLKAMLDYFWAKRWNINNLPPLYLSRMGRQVSPTVSTHGKRGEPLSGLGSLRVQRYSAMSLLTSRLRPVFVRLLLGFGLWYPSVEGGFELLWLLMEHRDSSSRMRASCSRSFMTTGFSPC